MGFGAEIRILSETCLEPWKKTYRPQPTWPLGSYAPGLCEDILSAREYFTIYTCTCKRRIYDLEIQQNLAKATFHK